MQHNNIITNLQLKKLQPAELLQMFRRRSNLTQIQVAEGIGLESKRMVQSWEAGETLPKPERLLQLLQFFLERKVFLSGQELKEAQELWECVKNYFDATSRGLAAYPVFDQSWFEQRLRQVQTLPEPPISRVVSASVKLASSKQSNLPNNLAVPSNQFFGRERELKELEQLVTDARTRLITLYGPGGTGKTRLALQLAQQLMRSTLFTDGVYWVDLSAIRDPRLLFSAIGQALGLKETAATSLEETLKQFVQESYLLLILDNFEQISSAAPNLSELLGYCPNLKVIVTSRNILQLYTEQLYPVFPLEVPPIPKLSALTSPSSSLEELNSWPAVQLFVAQAQRGLPGFALTVENAPVIAQICARLDGLPLAIELAAARVRLLPPRVLLKRLDKRFELLQGGALDRPPRQQTLQAALDWSYDLLDEGEKWVLRCSAVFAGGISLNALERVGAELSPAPASEQAESGVEATIEVDLLESLAGLVNKSFLYSTSTAPANDLSSEVRFTMLETVRQYALKQLEQTSDRNRFFELYSQYFLELAQQVEPKIRESSQPLWLNLLEVEHNNFRAVLGWFLEKEAFEKALQLAACLWWFWNVRGYLSEGVDWLTRAFSDSEKKKVAIPLATRARALHALAALRGNLGQYEEATPLMLEELELQRNLGDKKAISVCLHNLGVVHRYRDDYPTALQFHQESLNLKREIGYDWGIAHSLDELGAIATLQGNYEQGQQWLEESWQLFRRLGDNYGLANMLINLGQLRLYQGHYEEAGKYFEQSLELVKELANPELYAELMRYQGLLELYQGQVTSAIQLFQQSLGLFEENQHRLGISLSFTCLALAYRQNHQLEEAEELLKKALIIKQNLGIGEKALVSWDLEGLAAIAFERGEFSRSIELLSTAHFLRSSIGVVLPFANLEVREQILEQLRQLVSQSDFESAWQKGLACLHPFPD